MNTDIELLGHQNKPDGQYQMTFDRESIIAFMHDLPIRKVPGIGRVHERLLESVGIKVREAGLLCLSLTTHCRAVVTFSFIGPSSV